MSFRSRSNLFIPASVYYAGRDEIQRVLQGVFLMLREELLEKIFLLTEAIEAIDPTLEEQRQNLENDRREAMKELKKLSAPNPAGNTEALRPYQFQEKTPGEPLSKIVSFRLSERQFAVWQENRDFFTGMVREKLDSYQPTDYE